MIFYSILQTGGTVFELAQAYRARVLALFAFFAIIVQLLFLIALLDLRFMVLHGLEVPLLNR